MVVGVCDNDKLWCMRAEELIKKYAEISKEKIKIIPSSPSHKEVEGTRAALSLITV